MSARGEAGALFDDHRKFHEHQGVQTSQPERQPVAVDEHRDKGEALAAGEPLVDDSSGLVRLPRSGQLQEFPESTLILLNIFARIFVFPVGKSEPCEELNAVVVVARIGETDDDRVFKGVDIEPDGETARRPAAEGFTSRTCPGRGNMTPTPRAKDTNRFFPFRAIVKQLDTIGAMLPFQ